MVVYRPAANSACVFLTRTSSTIYRYAYIR